MTKTKHKLPKEKPFRISAISSSAETIVEEIKDLSPSERDAVLRLVDSAFNRSSW